MFGSKEAPAPIGPQDLEKFLDQQYQEYLEGVKPGNNFQSRQTFGDNFMGSHGLKVSENTVTTRSGSIFAPHTHLSNFLDEQVEARAEKPPSQERQPHEDPNDFYLWQRQQQQLNEQQIHLDMIRRQQTIAQDEQDAKWREQGLLPKEDAHGRISSQQEMLDHAFGKSPPTESDRHQDFLDKHMEREYGSPKPPDHGASGR